MVQAWVPALRRYAASAGTTSHQKRYARLHFILVSHSRGLLSEAWTVEATVLRIGDLTIDVEAHTVHRGDETIGLTPLEFDLLLALARKPRQAFTRELLLQEVWGYRHPGDTRLVNVHVQRLRSKIERDPERPEIIVTVRGIGYRAGTPAT